MRAKPPSKTALYAAGYRLVCQATEYNESGDKPNRDRCLLEAAEKYRMSGYIKLMERCKDRIQRDLGEEM